MTFLQRQDYQARYFIHELFYRFHHGIHIFFREIEQITIITF